MPEATEPTVTTIRLTDVQGKCLHSLISLGYGTGNDFMPFSSEELRRRGLITRGEANVIGRLLTSGLVTRGVVRHPVYGLAMAGNYWHTSPDGATFETNGMYRLTPAAIAAYADWYTDRGWRVSR